MSLLLCQVAIDDISVKMQENFQCSERLRLENNESVYLLVHYLDRVHVSICGYPCPEFFPSVLSCLYVRVYTLSFMGLKRILILLEFE